MRATPINLINRLHMSTIRSSILVSFVSSRSCHSPQHFHPIRQGRVAQTVKAIGPLARLARHPVIPAPVQVLVTTV